MKKKIIFVTEALWIGGIETALVNLLKHFDYKKYEVTLLVLHAELDMLEQVPKKCRVLIVDREKVVSFDKPYPYNKLFHLTEAAIDPSRFHKMMMWSIPIIKWIENRLYIYYIRNLLKEEYFDIAVIYSDVVGETTVRAISADKYLLYYHHGAMRHVYHDAVAYRKSDKIITVSNNQAELLRKFVPEYAAKVVTVHNLTDIEGIRTKGYMNIVEDFDSSRFNIVTVGRVSHEKGMDIAVRVCAKLVKDGYDNIRWWIVGDGPAMQEVREIVIEEHVEDYVILVGMRSNPYPYIRQADLYVQPSRFEGYPMTVLEALILGQPVVSTNNNGAKEILKDGITGLLCSIDEEAIEHNVKLLLNNPKKLKKMKQEVARLDFQKRNKESIYILEKLMQ